MPNSCNCATTARLVMGTWNIRSIMLQLGNVQLLGEEMMRLGVDIYGLSEVRWNGQGHFTTLNGHTIVYSGRLTQGMSGVAVWIHRKIAGALVDMNQSATESLLCDSRRNHETLLCFSCMDQRPQLQMKKWRGSTKTCLKQLNKSPRGTCCL